MVLQAQPDNLILTNSAFIMLSWSDFGRTDINRQSQLSEVQLNFTGNLCKKNETITTPRKGILKIVKSQTLVAKCCKIRKISLKAFGISQVS